MKKKILRILLILSAIAMCSGCGGTSGTSLPGGGSQGVGPSTPTTEPISIEYLDGKTNVSVDASFLATFSEPVDTSTVTVNTFFIVENSLSGSISKSVVSPKETFRSDICNPNLKLDSTVSCLSTTRCLLDPSNDLEYNTRYTICVVGNDDPTKTEVIRPLEDGTVNSESHTFVTASSQSARLLCGSLSPEIEISSTESPSNVYTIGITDPWRYGYMDCTLSITTNVSAAGNIVVTDGTETLDTTASKENINPTIFTVTFPEPVDSSFNVTNSTTEESTVTYSFKNGCSLSDDFNTNSGDCWSVLNGTWAELEDEFVSIDSGNSLLKFDNSESAEPGAYILKWASIDSGGFEIIIHFDSISGYTDEGEDALQGERINAFITTDPDAEVTDQTLMLGVGSYDGAQYCFIRYEYGNDDTGERGGAGVECPLTSSDYYIRIGIANDILSAGYSTDGSTYTNLDISTFPSGETILSRFTENALIGMLFADVNITGNKTADIDSILFSGLTSSNQF